MQVIYFLLAIYGLTIFVITLILIVPCYFLVFLIQPENKIPFVAHKFTRLWGNILLPLVFVRVKIKNKELIKKNRTYVFIANHLSQLDIPVYVHATHNVLRFLAKAELGKIPLLGYVIKKTYFMVRREDKSDRQKIMQLMKQTLEQRIGLFICPEGTRNRTKNILLPFKDGAFRLAIEAQVPLAVFVVYDSYLRNKPSSPLSLIPGTIHGEWIEVVDTTGMTEKDVPALKERVWRDMEKSIIAFRNKK